MFIDGFFYNLLFDSINLINYKEKQKKSFQSFNFHNLMKLFTRAKKFFIQKKVSKKKWLQKFVVQIVCVA